MISKMFSIGIRANTRTWLTAGSVYASDALTHHSWKGRSIRKSSIANDYLTETYTKSYATPLLLTTKTFGNGNNNFMQAAKLLYQSFPLPRKETISPHSRTSSEIKPEHLFPEYFNEEKKLAKDEKMHNVKTIYALLCEDDMIYVGITSDLPKRLLQHFKGSGGSQVTKKYRPIKRPPILVWDNVPECYAHGLESLVTAIFMAAYGPNSVRGAEFASKGEYTTDDIGHLKKFLGHHLGLDYDDVELKLKELLPPPSYKTTNSIPKPKSGRQ